MVGSHRSLRHLAVLALPAIAAWLVVSRGEIGMSPDSLFYWSAAHTMRGMGMVATGVSARDYARTVGDGRLGPEVGVAWPDGSVTYPLTVWPPGYPAAIAVLMPLTGDSAVAAARLLAALTLVLSIGAFAVAGAELVDRSRAAFAAALVMCLPFAQSTVRMMWSDALFTALALVALALLARAFAPTARPGAALVLAAMASAVATYVRYTGVLVLAAGIVASALLALRTPRRRGMLVGAVVAVGLYGLLVAPLFARNFSLAGDLTGAERSPADESALRLFAGFVLAFAKGVVPWVGAAVPGPRDALVTGGVSVGAWAITGAMLATAIRRGGGLAEATSTPAARRPMALILVVFAGLYSTVLLGLRMVWHFDFNTRMLLPAVASAALLVACVWESRIADAQVWRVNGIALVMIPLVTVASLAAVDHYIPWRGYNSAEFQDRPVARWARAALARAGPDARLRFLSVGYFIPFLHFATRGAAVGGLPDAPTPGALLAGSPFTGSVVVLEPGGRRFQCPAYQGAYEQVLDGAADSTVRGEGFTAWWLSAASASRLERGAGAFAPSCH
ncbi:MAG TPA: glycosyltransferase family 39 protein [Gemmatimonadales bacterium]|nr:glycosyltransferase family 39 protein [Gemmatimonadales bacterium]